MTKINAKIIADSKNEFGNRITTMVVTFPRFILAELNTHRMMSRNSASSRAIPFEKMLHSIENNPFIPIAIQKDHKGMQGTEYLEGVELENALKVYGICIDNALVNARRFANTDATKQLVNRQLEPFMWHTVIITATEWENFFALRCPRYEIANVDIDGKTTVLVFRSRKDFITYVKEYNTKQGVGNDELINELKIYTTIDWLYINKGQAEIHMMELAEQMWDAMSESTPKELKAGEWHIPFGDTYTNIDYFKLKFPTGVSEDKISTEDIENIKIKIATARCARVSYTVVGEEDKEPNYENDIKLHDRLRESGHMSPFEHCAKAMDEDDIEYSGNFKGFIQYRKTLPNENITK